MVYAKQNQDISTMGCTAHFAQALIGQGLQSFWVSIALEDAE